MSSTIPLLAETGRVTGSGASGRLRSAGKVPAIVYGHGTEALPVTVDHRELDLGLSTPAGRNVIFELSIGGDTKTAVAHVVERHPTKHRIRHVDFLLVDLDQVVVADIPVRVEGEGPGVKEGGIVELLRPTVQVSGVVAKLPNEIVIDGSNLAVGDTVTIGELPAIPEMEYPEDPELAVLTVTITLAALHGDDFDEEVAEEAAPAVAEEAAPAEESDES